LAVKPGLTWSVNIGRDEPQKRAIVLGSAFIVAAVGLFLPFGGAMYALVGFALVTLSNAEVFLPQFYKIDDGGVERKCGLSVTAMAWDRIKRIVPDDVGIKFSPFEKPTRSDPFRGVYVRFADNRDEVLAKLSAHLDEYPELLGRGALRRGGSEVDRADLERDHEAADGGPGDSRA